MIVLSLAISYGVPATARADQLEIWEIWANGSLGSATLIRGPNGTVVLYDLMGGSPGASYLRQLLYDVGITHIDYTIAGHYDADHIGGLNSLWNLMGASHSNFGTYYDRGGSVREDGSAIPSGYYDVVNGSGKRATVSVNGSSDINLGDGAVFRFLSAGAPDETGNIQHEIYIRNRPSVTADTTENNKSISALLTYGGFDMYMGSDLEGTGERAIDDVIVDDLGRDVDILLVDHHGANTFNISSSEFLSKMNPEVALISVWNNSHDHPNYYTVTRLQAVVEPYEQRIIRLCPGDNDPPPDGGWAPEDMAYCHTTNRHVYISTDGNTYTVDTVERDGGNDITEPGLTRHPADQGFQLLVTEVGVDANEPVGHDWVELYMGSGAVDVSSIYMTDGDDVFPIAGNGELTMTEGDVLIVHDSGETSDSENNISGKGGNGLWDVYQPLLDLSDEDDQFIVSVANTTTPSGSSILDAVCWSNDDGAMDPDEADDGNNLIIIGQWGDPITGYGWFAVNDDSAAIGDINGGYAQRLYLTDDDDVGDWTISGTHSYGVPPSGYVPTPTPTPTPGPGDVVINEIAWMGTLASPSDEWIEFYNRTRFPIDIANWSIYGADAGVTLNFASRDGATTTVIPPFGYLVYANDLSVFSSGATEHIWDATIDPVTGSGLIILYSGPNGTGFTVDTANNGGAWFAGTNDSYKRSMERENPDLPGTDPSNWTSFNGTPFAKDAVGNWINGSPGGINSVYSGPPTVTPSVTPTATRSPHPTRTPTVTPTPTPTPTQTPVPWIARTSFEYPQTSDPIGYTLSGNVPDDPGSDPWGRWATNPLVGSYSFAAVDCTNGGACTFDSIDVSGYTDVAVHLWLMTSGEFESDPEDYARAYVRVDGQNMPYFLNESGPALNSHDYEEYIYTVPAGANSIVIVYQVRDSANDERIYLDEVQVWADQSIPNQSPYGSLGGASATSIGGWGYDPDVGTSPIDVEFYFDGVAGSGTYADTVTADGYRPDVPINVPLVQGDYHGFNWNPWSFIVDQGYAGGSVHDVYVYLVNYPAGTNPLLGTSSITVP